MKKLTYLLFLTMLFTIDNQCFSQMVVGTAGNHSEGPDLSLSWTVGEVITETFEVGNLTLTQGMHQPHISVTGMEWFAPQKITFDVYPNPTADFVYIQTIQELEKEVSYKLYSTSGNLIKSDKIANTLISIDFRDYSSQIYVLKFFEENQIIGQCKVIKK